MKKYVELNTIPLGSPSYMIPVKKKSSHQSSFSSTVNVVSPFGEWTCRKSYNTSFAVANTCIFLSKYKLKKRSVLFIYKKGSVLFYIPGVQNIHYVYAQEEPASYRIFINTKINKIPLVFTNKNPILTCIFFLIHNFLQV